jgi:serine/threonine protein kinase
VAWVVRIGCQLAEALCAAHAKGIVHRDLKPENVMLVPDSAAAGGERVKLLDFGLAKLAEAGPLKTTDSAIMGTPRYMSPEQALGAGKVDEKTDVYALGVMLFELLSGRPPFTGVPGELIAQHLYTPPPELTSIVPALSPAMAQLIERMLAKDRLQRPTMATVHKELQAQLSLFHDQDFQAPAEPQPSVTQTLLPYKEPSTLGFSASQVAQGRKRGPLIGAGVVAAILGIGGWALFHVGHTPKEKTSAAPLPATSPAPDGANQQAAAPPLHSGGTADSEKTVIPDRKMEPKKGVQVKAAPKSKAKSKSKASSTSAPLFKPKSWMNK